MRIRKNGNLRIERTRAGDIRKSRNKKKMQNRLLIILICFTLICIIGALGYHLIRDKKTEKENTPITTNDLNEDISKDALSKDIRRPEPDERPIPEVKDDPNITGYDAGHNVFVYNKMGFEIFGGSEKTAQAYAAIIKDAKRRLPDGITIYSMVIPTHIEFGLPPKHKRITHSQKDNIDTIYSECAANGITCVDVYSTLQRYSDEYAYFNTDHHWTVDGAYLGYKEFAKKAGFKPYELGSLTKKTIPDFLGTYYNLTKDNNLKNNPDHVDYYLIPGTYECMLLEKNAKTPKQVSSMLAESAEGRNAYSVFAWGDNQYMQIKNQQKNGRRIAVIGESYKNAFALFLASYYEEVHILDPRYFTTLDLIKYVEENGITDVLFINNGLAANSGQYQKALRNILH